MPAGQRGPVRTPASTCTLQPNRFAPCQLKIAAIEARNNSNLAFIDIWNAMLDNGGKPRGELFVEDELQLNRAGYELWAQIVGPHLKPI